jgi:hypothetical protein
VDKATAIAIQDIDLKNLRIRIRSSRTEQAEKNPKADASSLVGRGLDLLVEHVIKHRLYARAPAHEAGVLEGNGCISKAASKLSRSGVPVISAAYRSMRADILAILAKITIATYCFKKGYIS